VLAMASDAKRMPAREAAYRNLVLNQRVEASSPFVTPQQWKACAGEPLDLRGRDVFAGLDLSETRDLTALVLLGQDIRDGTWHVVPTFWLPVEPARKIEERSRSLRQLGGKGIPADDAGQHGVVRVCRSLSERRV